MSSLAPQTLTEAVLSAGDRFPSRGIGLYDRRGRQAQRLTYAELAQRAMASAARLRTLGLQPKERLLVCLPTSWEWWDAWMGALLLGAIPVAVAPAGAMGSSAGHTRKLADLVDLLGGRLVAANSVREGARSLQLTSLEAGLLTPSEIASTAPTPGLRPATPQPEDLAFLQLTSGSTGRPRAVMISHRAAIHNGLASSIAIGAPIGAPLQKWADAMVSWLPLHHDMGLVGCLFLCLCQGLDLWLLNPATFLARPHLWLENLSRHGTTFTAAPNFGYQLCVERIAPGRLEGLDLSGWQAAMTGAEMVRPETAAALTRLLEPHGFVPECLRPCYGLAEGTLAVTFDLQGKGPRTRPLPTDADRGFGLSDVVCLGQPIGDTELVVCDPGGNSLPEGSIGEVRVKGPSIFDGYFHDPQATAEALKDGWLLTGDLGFVHAGELYLTGRTKDLLILRGHNLMPHELEWLAESVAGGGGALRAGAFSIAQGAAGEQAIVILETKARDPTALAGMARDLRLEVAEALGITLADVAFVRRGKIPKTTSGKVQRHQLRAAYLADELDRL